MTLDFFLKIVYWVVMVLVVLSVFSGPVIDEIGRCRRLRRAVRASRRKQDWSPREHPALWK